ncbi:uncharacterized protein CIMG_10320 [Coccidioides immitis RS]|uniref:Uncharacterized protein n=1 Tax=Coccidioides immitis (strain RS) TaxID=246410 RepID=J3K192_COCIM|nr:uncharacterized protein CIMG_10320 [Coccidioides immitis RS]EAS27715.3 hypothetical protein CIMG_10320 [Coccidioides immitis RS]
MVGTGRIERGLRGGRGWGEISFTKKQIWFEVMSPSKSMNEGYAGDANLGSNQRPPRLDGESLSRSKSWRLGTHDHIQLSTSSSDPLGAHRSSTSLTSKTSKIRTNGHYGSANTHYRSRW